VNIDVRIDLRVAGRAWAHRFAVRDGLDLDLGSFAVVRGRVNGDLCSGVFAYAIVRPVTVFTAGALTRQSCGHLCAFVFVGHDVARLFVDARVDDPVGQDVGRAIVRDRDFGCRRFLGVGRGGHAERDREQRGVASGSS
jgi:hypothetical protein